MTLMKIITLIEIITLMKGSVDLSELALLGGYAASSRCMTAMGIQVLGTVLNKTVSRGYDQWAW